MPKRVDHIPSSVTSVDLKTGKETHHAGAWRVIPPPADCCQICAVKHIEVQPHNAQSLYYQMIFTNMIGRAPTWADAMAHCTPVVQAQWRGELERRNAWSEPPAGEKPVEHFGVE